MSDPITLLVIIGAAAGLNVQTRSRLIVDEKYQPPVALVYAPTLLPIITGRNPQTATALLQSSFPGISLMDQAITALSRCSAANAAAGKSQRPAQEAKALLAALPQYIPVPKVAESETGLLTLFWDTTNFYADIEFRGDGKFSVFTRDRSRGIDEVLDNEPVDQVRGNWLVKYLGPLLPKGEAIKAA